MANKPRSLILDACVLIDFVEADRSILRVVAESLSPIAIARPVFDEVQQLDEDEADELGLEIVDIDFALAVQAAAPVGALSFEDRICVLLATREGWTCVSNDVALRRSCEQENVPVMWGLELLLKVAQAGGVGKKEAETIATTIHAQNPHYVTANILRAFLGKLRKI